MMDFAFSLSIGTEGYSIRWEPSLRRDWAISIIVSMRINRFSWSITSALKRESPRARRSILSCIKMILRTLSLMSLHALTMVLLRKATRRRRLRARLALPA